MMLARFVRQFMLWWPMALGSQLCQAGVLDFWRDDEPVLVVKDPFVEMHTGPGRGFPVFHVVEKGLTLTLEKRRTDWFKVNTPDGKAGWVHRRELTKTLAQSGDELDLAAPDRDDYTNRRFEFGVLGGNFEGADSLTTYLGFYLTQNISAELKYTQSFSDVGTSQLYSVNAVHKPFPKWRISPFFTLGTGEITVTPSSNLVQFEQTTNPTYTVGAGAALYLSSRFLMRLEYNNHTLITDRAENEEVEEWKAGFSMFF